MSRDPYTYAPRLCSVCEGTFTPTGAVQKYCLTCKPLIYRRNWREAKRNNRTRGPHKEAEYIRNDITDNTDFLDIIRQRIREQRGDLVTVKKLVRYVLTTMKLTSVSNHAKKVCYAATDRIIVDEFKGEQYGRSYYGGNTFRIRKERKK